MDIQASSLFGLVVLLLASCAIGNETDMPDKPAQESTISVVANMAEEGLSVKNNYKDFIPDGYSLLDSATGDLNLDAFPDMLLVLKSAQEDSRKTYEKEMPRPLVILLGQKDGSYRLGGRSDNIVLCRSCGGVFGDPYEGLTIKDGYFSVEHYGGSNWRWTLIVTFKYNKDDGKWYLHKEGGDSYHTSDPDKVETTVKTTKDFGKVLFEDYHYE